MGVAPQQTSINDKKSPPLKNHTLMPQKRITSFQNPLYVYHYVCVSLGNELFDLYDTFKSKLLKYVRSCYSVVKVTAIRLPPRLLYISIIAQPLVVFQAFFTRNRKLFFLCAHLNVANLHSLQSATHLLIIAYFPVGCISDTSRANRPRSHQDTPAL